MRPSLFGAPTRVALGLAVLSACSDRGSDTARVHYGVGRAASAAEIAVLDVDVGPDGAGMPPGSGTAALGAAIYATKCAACHGASGEGVPPAIPRLVGRDSIAEGFPFAMDARLGRTIGNYWPYAATVFGYIRRSMPPEAPGSLTNDEVYALTAWLLAENQIIPGTLMMDSGSLAAVRMPYAGRFVPDDRRGGREVR